MTQDQLEILRKVCSNLLNMRTREEYQKFKKDILDTLNTLAHSYAEEGSEYYREKYQFFNHIKNILNDTSFYSAED